MSPRQYKNKVGYNPPPEFPPDKPHIPPAPPKPTKETIIKAKEICTECLKSFAEKEIDFLRNQALYGIKRIPLMKRLGYARRIIWGAKRMTKK